MELQGMSLLLKVHGAARELAEQLAAEPPCIAPGFVEDVETLIRQNAILKREADAVAVDVLRY